jgi:flagellar FliJ protein
MRKFKFRLEKIRKFKEQLETSKKMKLAEEQAVRQVERARLSGIITVREKYFSQYGVRKPGKVNISDLILAKRYLDKLARDVNRQTEKVKTADRNVAKAQEALLKATREKKKYEKLKERHLLKYNEELLHTATKELDEFGARSKAQESHSII